MPRHRRRSVLRLSSLLMWLAEVADRECPAGHGAALRDAGALAVTKVPSRGVLWKPGDRDDSDLFRAIELIAKRHLGYAEPVSTFQRGLEAIVSKTTLYEREALQNSCLQAESVSDTAHYYTGLAFGVTFVDGTNR